MMFFNRHRLALAVAGDPQYDRRRGPSGPHFPERRVEEEPHVKQARQQLKRANEVLRELDRLERIATGREHHRR